MQRDISGNHTSDWDEQRERLSAYLDGELDEGERVALERHLPTCEQCQRALDEYREVRALLRAMPVPAMPRSFAIPTEGAIPVPLAAATSEGTTGAEQQRRRQRTRRGGGIWSGVAQALGSFVAAAGVILVLGSALTGTGRPLSSASMPASGSAGSGASSSQQHEHTSTAYGSRATPTATGSSQDTAKATASSSQETPRVPEQNKGVPTPIATSTAKGGSTPGTTRNNIQAAPGNSENVPVVPIGAGMVAGGGVLYVAGRVSGNRRRRGRDRT